MKFKVKVSTTMPYLPQFWEFDVSSGRIRIYEVFNYHSGHQICKMGAIKKIQNRPSTHSSVHKSKIIYRCLLQWLPQIIPCLVDLELLLPVPVQFCCIFAATKDKFGSFLKKLFHSSTSHTYHHNSRQELSVVKKKK